MGNLLPRTKFASQTFVFQRWNDAETRGIEITVRFDSNYIEHNITYTSKGKVFPTVRMPKFHFEVSVSPLPHSESSEQFKEWLLQNLPLIPCPLFRVGENVDYKASLGRRLMSREPFLKGDWLTLRPLADFLANTERCYNRLEGEKEQTPVPAVRFRILCASELSRDLSGL